MNRIRANPSSEEAKIRPFCSADILQVVDLHLGTFQETFISSLGRRFLERAIYPTMLHPASTGFGYVQVRNGKVVGFIVGMLDISAWYRTLVRTHWRECLLATARKCFQGWSDLLHLVRTVWHLLAGPFTEAGGKLYFLAIDESYKGRGLAVKLIQAFLDYCRSRGVSRCSVNTSKANMAAHRLYTHAGFQVEREFTVHKGTAVAYSIEFETPDRRG